MHQEKQTIPLKLITFDKLPIYEQLRFEEALVRLGRDNYCILNTGTKPSVVMGISGKPQELIHEHAILEDGISVIKRFSGGGCIYADEDTIFLSFIMQKNISNQPISPKSISQWTESILKPILKIEGFRLKENDYVIHEKKFGGNAQYIRKNCWLHHSCIVWKYCKKTMQRYLKHPPKEPKYRAKRKHGDFICQLSDYFTSKKHFLEVLQRGIHHDFYVEETDRNSLKNLLKQEHRKSTKILEIKKSALRASRLTHSTVYV